MLAAALADARCSRCRTGASLRRARWTASGSSDGEPVARHPQQVELRVARRRLEVAAGPAAELHDVEVVVDEHAGRRVAREQDVIDLALHVERRARGVGAAARRQPAELARERKRQARRAAAGLRA